jgi:hypothetical protein
MKTLIALLVITTASLNLNAQAFKGEYEKFKLMFNKERVKRGLDTLKYSKEADTLANVRSRSIFMEICYKTDMEISNNYDEYTAFEFDYDVRWFNKFILGKYDKYKIEQLATIDIRTDFTAWSIFKTCLKKWDNHKYYKEDFEGDYDSFGVYWRHFRNKVIVVVVLLKDRNG